MSDFIQKGPKLSGNQYEQDQFLKRFLQWRMPEDILRQIEPDLKRLGQRVTEDLLEWADTAEREEPQHVPYDPWGERIDEIRVSPAWQALDRAAAEEGMIAIGYERKQGGYSRLYQLIKLYLFHPSSAIYSCPLAMADGAARALEVYGDKPEHKEAFKHLTSRNPSEFWTSGQWMTERPGGSDVSRTETVAKVKGEDFELHGVKWFSSATTSQMSLALARIEGAEEGSRGLSLFFLKMRKEDGRLNGIEVRRLKDKLGTKALPTAELDLKGTKASVVGGVGQGVKKIASMLNITRMYNSVCAVGQMHRTLVLACDYAKKREAFGRALVNQPLHVETLANERLKFKSAFLLTFVLAEWLGKEELGETSEQESMVLRLMIPVAKLYTAKIAVSLTSEMLEAIGGAGYIEDTGFPVLLRNAQVFPIWEGTTNVLSLDVLRVMQKPEAFIAFVKDVGARLSQVKNPALVDSVTKVDAALKSLQSYVKDNATQAADDWQACARDFAQSLALIFTASLMLEMSEWGMNKDQDYPWQAFAQRWCEQDLCLVKVKGEIHRKDSSRLAFL